MKILERIEILRKAKLLSKAEVYDLIGISQSMVSMIRSGDRQPSVKILRQLADCERAAGIGPPEVATRALPSEPMMVREESSNDWKNVPENFQRLEKRMDGLESMLQELLDWTKKKDGRR